MRGGPGGPTIWENDGPPLTVESCACADGAAKKANDSARPITRALNSLDMITPRTTPDALGGSRPVTRYRAFPASLKHSTTCYVRHGIRFAIRSTGLAANQGAVARRARSPRQ